ncbi:MAG TPA: ATP-binding protein [Gammaproteobacteria bacterium]|nr:ATP-binding protein [Gammaproteobacteria bacterium]
MSARYSLNRKLLLVLAATTASALLITGAAMAVYDIATARRTSIDDLAAQADILGLAAEPALEFDDPRSAKESLELLKAKPSIVDAAIYTAKGTLFASYSSSSSAAPSTDFPDLPGADGLRFEGNALSLFKRIDSNGEILGTVFLRARYSLAERLLDFLGIAGAVMVFSFSASLLMSRRLQQSITRPILGVTTAAREVIEHRDFSTRVPKTTDDEIGVLVDAFNGMLAEIGAQHEGLESSNRQLEQAEERLRTLNAELEARVAARTAELEAANKDLEGFSYSVSHDLRAPIRAITGFCSLLEADHQNQLDAEAQRKLGIVKSEAERMGTLIDDLLAFSRLGRKALRPTQLDMTELARGVFERLTGGEQAQNIEFRLGSLPGAAGDRSLFEQVWTNLLSNAIKFSAKKDHPKIEVGGLSDEREHVYFVRDNGAGFDPSYSTRLFGVFQRLHHDHEFAGTGVGLALVHKIVTRHGGRIWAEGKPCEGATFHFTLPKEQAHGRV